MKLNLQVGIFSLMNTENSNSSNFEALKVSTFLLGKNPVVEADSRGVTALGGNPPWFWTLRGLNQTVWSYLFLGNL